MSKSIFRYLGETIDRNCKDRRARRLASNANESDGSVSFILTRIIRWFIPNGGTIAIVFALLIANNAGALTLGRSPESPQASTTTIPYQGRLADTGGNPLTGTYAMTFRLYAAPSGGSALWTETWTGGTGVHANAGLFNIMLGSYTPISQTVVTDNSTLWLGITVGTDVEMSPRVQLGSVLFAVQALTVPDGSVTTAKIADGAITSRKLTQTTYTQYDDSSITLSTVGAWYDFTPLTINIPSSEVPAVTKALILFDARCSSTTDSMAISFLDQLDGVSSPSYTNVIPRANQWLNVSMHDLVTLGANANHTIKIQWSLALASGTADCSNRRLTVILLGQ